ncbi:hypothetical protein ABT158_28585 [Nonomuraea sp. NPDC001636]|uniref:hypothetical protein n=1 Tax=Nonomuraea sp. NPDC001636 TaxID=3154391 RepID=UPI00331A0B52
MQLSVFVIAAVVTLAIPAVAMTVVAIVALRGTQPDERPEILRALAVLGSGESRLDFRIGATQATAVLPGCGECWAGAGVVAPGCAGGVTVCAGRREGECKRKVIDRTP